MKTLVIHPEDKTTSFLDIIYNDIPDKTVITKGVKKHKLKKLIQEHDRIMMMGHGSSFGLFSVGKFPDSNGYIIDYTMIKELEKKDNIFIWCNADKFVERAGLKGFSSGMFISEVEEAGYCGVFDTNQTIVDESNITFCNIMKEHIHEETSELQKNVKEKYGELGITNKVAEYNSDRLYLFS